ncbi:MAG: hypothetical protein A2Y73_02115 [Chloroflexi bacterium RBG_13_56_8]|nr:MAG: hypothetical protein A2Y73_02115 [Chloroflexi bacterium RBG_13_56_8]
MKPAQTEVTLLHWKLIVSELGCVIRAGIEACVAADAQILIHHHNAILSSFGDGTCETGSSARWL